VQKNRLVYVVRGWGAEMFSALIENGELYGDTDRPEVWSRLANLLAERWGDDLAIRAMMVDSGFRADKVYAFARRYAQVRATKGHDTLSAPVKASKVDVTVRGQLQRAGLQLWHVDAGYFKSWVHARIDWPADQPGAWLLPNDVSEEYCKQLVAESLIQLPNGARVWKKTSPDNHYLDAEVLATAGAHILQLHRERRAAAAGHPKPQDASPAPAPTASSSQSSFGRNDWSDRW
jgi:phage terminase large subunit GpA-like protein